MKRKTLVSICCLSYNHSKFIRKCLDSLLMQKTNFDYEILIHDDASNDGSDEIIKEYVQKYPNIIKPLFESENMHSKEVAISKTFNFPRVQGKYVAMCEGDDYWTDEYKLQKQVDFMEENPEYSISFHKVQKIFEDGSRKSEVSPTQNLIDCGFNFLNLLECNFIQTNSVLYRWNDSIVKNLPDNIIPGDWYLHLLFAKQGKIHFINETMAVYRVNAGGIWGGKKHEERLVKYPFKIMNFYLNVFKNIAPHKLDYIKHVYDNYVKIRKTLKEYNSEYYSEFCKKYWKIKFLFIILKLRRTWMIIKNS